MSSEVTLERVDATRRYRLEESKPAMGVLISRPASKFTDGEENDRIKYAVSSMQGRCEKMEDASAAILDLDGTKSTSFFGVYDGHGGAEVALYCARQFHTVLLNHPDYHDNLANAMEAVFFSMDEQLQQSDEWRKLVNPRGNSDRIVCLENWTEFVKTGVCANLWPFTQETPYIGPAHEGSTACMVLIRGNQIIVGNVGDSRCVLSRNGQAIDLSTDHKPNHQLERQRILKAGGQVVRGGGVFNPQWGIVQIFEGTLSFSRGIGHFAFKQNKNLPLAEQMVTCNPDISTVNITNDTEFLVIASDGIWDCLSSQNVVDFIHQHLISGETDLRVTCEALLDRCLPSSTDNMTAVLVQFKTGAGIPALSDTQAEDAAEWLRLPS